ncbi:M14 family zinc carboxypeptidase [Rhodoferax sp.]|uniref:M14 family zinc carboxypeptidase n=1 Tax=Rhodoferax sp. TaxID=50421 RepID=UPI0026200023|nr:M14 family zinc carboxypeptidase [Rhodoferax sp.]
MFTSINIAAYASATSVCDGFYKKLPNVSRVLCQQAQLLPSGAHSVQGRPLLMRDVVPSHTKWRVLVVAAMHGDEFSSASVALHWLALAQSASEATHWRFVPVLNPDGLLRQPARRMNAHGVDLNRNFPTPNWQLETKNYWEKLTRKDPRRWPGKAPLSEPESKFLFDQMASFKPDVIVSIHAPYGVLDFDGPVLPPTKLGRLYLDQVGVFPGSLGNYAGVHNAMPVVTVELPSALRTPTEAEMLKMWLDLRRWMDQTQLARQ